MGNNNDELIIGTSNYDGRGGLFSKKKYFYVKPNEPNIFRVLPPVRSLAATGEFFKYHQVHRNMRATDGKQRSFVCTEEMDWKTKILKRRCPVCDKYRGYEAQYKSAYEAAKTGQGPTKEQLNEFRMTYLDPLQVEKKYYMNVVNQVGEIGILTIPTTLKKDMIETFKRIKAEENVDPTGKVGIFFNFIKISQYKGDNKPLYKVEPYYEVTPGADGRVNKKYKYHEITPLFLDQMKKDVNDLSSLHRSITVEEMAALANADFALRKTLLDQLFKFAEAAEEGSEDTQPVPGVGGVSATTTIGLGSGGLTAQSFNNAPASQPQAAAPLAMTSGFIAPAPAAAPVQAAPAAAPAQPTAPAFDFGSLQQGQAAAPTAPAKTLSDADFQKYFMGGNGK